MDGRREYSDLDIERLSLLSDLCTLGHSISKVAKLSTDELRKQLKKLGKSSKSISQKRQPRIKQDYNIEQSRELLLSALKEFKLNVIGSEINRLKILLDPKVLALEVINPLLKEVHKNSSYSEISDSKKSALASILKFHMGHILFRTSNKKSIKPQRVLICAPENVYQELSALQIALICSSYGIDYYYLGANLPIQSLLEAYQSLDCNVLILGVSQKDQEIAQDIVKYASKVSKEVKGAPVFLVADQVDSQLFKKVKGVNFIESLEKFDQAIQDF